MNLFGSDWSERKTEERERGVDVRPVDDCG